MRLLLMNLVSCDSISFFLVWLRLNNQEDPATKIIAQQNFVHGMESFFVKLFCVHLIAQEIWSFRRSISIINKIYNFVRLLWQHPPPLKIIKLNEGVKLVFLLAELRSSNNTPLFLAITIPSVTTKSIR